jgi:5-formyltetrahydrofolate cyclo-ligase
MPLTPNPLDKADIRRQLRARRKALSPAARLAASLALVRLALRHHLLAKGRRIGLYIPANHEIDVRPLLNRAVAMRVTCFLPIVPSRGRKRMWFSEMGDHAAWALNRYGIPEYLHPLAKRVRARRLDLLFMPLLGFDARGFRLGMGGGYYDASLSYRKNCRHWRRPRIVGVAYSVQEAERLPNDAWDIPLDAVLTDREYRVFRANRNP